MLLVQVGLVLDLTNTSRYYDSEDWEHSQCQGVIHKKVGVTHNKAASSETQRRHHA